MVKHHNTTLIQDIQRIFNFKGEVPLSEVSDLLIPVVLIARVANVIRQTTRTATGAAGIFSTPSDKDFYLVSCNLSSITDATSDGVRVFIRATISGVVREILTIRLQATVAEARDKVLVFNTPLKIDRGTNIDVVPAFTAGAEGHEASICGYTVETTSSDQQ